VTRLRWTSWGSTRLFWDRRRRRSSSSTRGVTIALLRRAATHSPISLAGAIYSDRPTAIMAGELSAPHARLLSAR
jgi:hypothetical protein